MGVRYLLLEVKIIPVANPEHRIIAREVLVNVWICRNCFARNPIGARRCRKKRCRSTNLRPKRRD
ncbi:MAG: 50S ribosomal protein L40e [Candidatus Kariarchaeaceae archaeon]